MIEKVFTYSFIQCHLRQKSQAPSLLPPTYTNEQAAGVSPLTLRQWLQSTDVRQVHLIRIASRTFTDTYSNDVGSISPRQCKQQPTELATVSVRRPGPSLLPRRMVCDTQYFPVRCNSTVLPTLI